MANQPPLEIKIESSHSNQNQQQESFSRSAFHTAITTPMELINEFHDTSFWSIAPRWHSSGFGFFSSNRNSGEHHQNPDGDSESIWNGNREVVCANDDDDYDEDEDDDTLHLGDRLKHYCSKINTLKYLWMGILLITGLALTLALTKNVQHVNLSDVMSFRRSYSYRYAAMKKLLVNGNVSSVEVLEVEDSAQHRALVFLAENDPFMLDPNDASAYTQLIQRYVLSVLYYSTDGPSWEHRTYWLTGQHECGWQFVICSEIRSNNANNDGFAVDADLGLGTGDVVTGLSLYDNNLRGVLPMHELMAMSHLHALDFGTNYLEGTLRSFRQLSELRTLYLNFNNFTGTIPDDLAVGLAKLKTLEIGNNRLSGSIPTRLLDGVTSLERLNLEGNDLTGSIPSQFDSETLQEIRLGENALSGTFIPSLFGTSTRPSAVTKIDLHGNLLSGGLPAIMNAPQLKILHLYENKLTGSIPETLLCQASNSLADLRLSDNAFTGTIPNLSCSMSELQLLSLSSNMLSGLIPESLGYQLPRIREIHFYENQLTSTIPESLFRLQNLTALLLGNNHLSSSLPSDMLINAKRLELFYVNANLLTGALDPIAASGSIKKLRLEYNQFSGTIPRMITPQLQLVYAYNNSLTGPLPRDCIWSNLQKLKLSNNSLTGEIALGSTGALEILDLGDNSFQGRIPTELGTLQSLKAINLQRNGLSGTIPSELHHLQQLEELRLDSNDISGVVASEICDIRHSVIEVFVADCAEPMPKVKCSCCTECN